MAGEVCAEEKGMDAGCGVVGMRGWGVGSHKGVVAGVAGYVTIYPALRCGVNGRTVVIETSVLKRRAKTSMVE